MAALISALQLKRCRLQNEVQPSGFLGKCTGCLVLLWCNSYIFPVLRYLNSIRENSEKKILVDWGGCSPRGPPLNTPLPAALIALSFRNGMRYHYLDVRINSANDASISCRNFVNCGPVTPEKTGLICVLFLLHGKNQHIQSNISGNTGPMFTIFSPYESALGADDRALPRFPIFQGTLLQQ